MDVTLNITWQNSFGQSWPVLCIKWHNVPPCHPAPAVSVGLPGSRGDMSTSPTEPPSQWAAPGMPGWPSPEHSACPAWTHNRCLKHVTAAVKEDYRPYNTYIILYLYITIFIFVFMLLLYYRSVYSALWKFLRPYLMVLLFQITLHCTGVTKHLSWFLHLIQQAFLP